MASCCRSSAQALFNVFVKPALTTGIRRPPPLILQHQHRLPQVRLGQRCFSQTVNRNNRKFGKSANLQRVQSAQLSDDRIPARRLQIVNEDGSLGEVVTKFSALLTLPPTERIICVSKVPRHVGPNDPSYKEVSRNFDFIVATNRRLTQAQSTPSAPKDALSAMEDGDAEEEEVADEDPDVEMARKAPGLLVEERKSSYIRLPTGQEWIPICKKENKAEATARAREAAARAKEAKKAAPEGVKIIELNWAIDVNNDLNHRLKKVREFLEGRRRVEIVIAPKKRGKRATPQEAEGVVKRVRKVVEEVDGAKEIRPMQGKVGEIVRLLFEGKRGA